MENTDNIQDIKISHISNEQTDTSSSESSSKYEKITTASYSTSAMLKEVFRKFFPFTQPGKEKYASIVCTILAGFFFAIPAMVSLLTYLSSATYLNNVSTNTMEFMSAAMKAMFVVLAWILVGHTINIFVTKKLPFTGYGSIGSFIRLNIVRCIFILLLAIMTVSTIFFSDTLYDSFMNVTDGMVVWYGIAGGCICVSLIKDKHYIRILLGVFVISAMVMTTVLYRQYVTKYLHLEMSDIWTTKMSEVKRTTIDLRHVRGVFANSNHCGYYLTMATLCSAGLLVTENKVWKKIFWGICLAILVNAVLLNDTAGCVLAVTITLLLSPIAFIGSKYKWYTRVAPMIIAALVIAFVSIFPNLPTGSKTFTNMIAELSSNVSDIVASTNDEQNNDDTAAATKDSTDSDQSDSQSSQAESESTSSQAESESTSSQAESELTSSTVKSDSQSSQAESESTSSQAESESTSSQAESGKVVVMNGHSYTVIERPLNDDSSQSAPPYEEIKDGWWLENQHLGTARLGLWQFGIELLRHQPWLGYGNHGTALRYEYQSGLANPAVRLHNEYLQFTVNFGIPAGVLYITTFVITIAYFFTHMKKRGSRTMVPETRILFLMFVAYSISAFFGIAAYYTVSYFMMIFVMLLSSFEGRTPLSETVAPALTENNQSPADEADTDYTTNE